MIKYKNDIKMAYVLEVQKYITDTQYAKDNDGRFEHVGYMNTIFKTKKEAAEYYDQHNPHMRSLNIHSNWCSDWDPKTLFRYVVRKYNHECMIINKF